MVECMHQPVNATAECGSKLHHWRKMAAFVSRILYFSFISGPGKQVETLHPSLYAVYDSNVGGRRLWWQHNSHGGWHRGRSKAHPYSLSAVVEKFSLCCCCFSSVFMSFAAVWECLYLIIYLCRRVYKQHCSVIPLSLIDLQPVIGESCLVVVSECWVLDGCHWKSALFLFSLFSCAFTLFNSLLSHLIYLPSNTILQIPAPSAGPFAQYPWSFSLSQTHFYV